jgi:hypothetical protein
MPEGRNLLLRLRFGCLLLSVTLRHHLGTETNLSKQISLTCVQICIVTSTCNLSNKLPLPLTLAPPVTLSENSDFKWLGPIVKGPEPTVGGTCIFPVGRVRIIEFLLPPTA